MRFRERHKRGNFGKKKGLQIVGATAIPRFAGATAIARFDDGVSISIEAFEYPIR
jgi:hypothetical protein